MIAQGASGPDDTFPKLLRRNARIYAARAACRQKILGIRHAWTWGETYASVRALAQALHGLGLRKGQRIAVAGANRPRLY